MLEGQADFVHDTADAIMPSEENNFSFAVKKLLEDFKKPVATRTILHSLKSLTSQFSTMPKDFEQYHDQLIQITKKINKQKVKNSILYSKVIDSLWPILTSKVSIHCFPLKICNSTLILKIILNYKKLSKK